MNPQVVIFCLVIISVAIAQQQQCGGEHHGVYIHKLFDNRAKIQRIVNETNTGIFARTFTNDTEVVKAIQNHVSQMKCLLENIIIYHLNRLLGNPKSNSQI
jgi:hypothetical protein